MIGDPVNPRPGEIWRRELLSVTGSWVLVNERRVVSFRGASTVRATQVHWVHTEEDCAARARYTSAKPGTGRTCSLTAWRKWIRQNTAAWYTVDQHLRLHLPESDSRSMRYGVDLRIVQVREASLFTGELDRRELFELAYQLAEHGLAEDSAHAAMLGAHMDHCDRERVRRDAVALASKLHDSPLLAYEKS